MKQYRITSENLIFDSPEDCFLASDDPIHELKIAQQLGGLGSEARLHEYRSTLAKESFINDERGKYQRENNIKPGTPAWFELWGNKS
jgi:hypothetical protein